MLSLVELRRAVRILQGFARRRIQAIVQPDGERVALTLYGGEGEQRGRLQLLLCCEPGSARVSLRAAPPPAPPTPPPFAQYLRAHLMNARVGRAELWNDDRQLALPLRAQEGDFVLLLALFGRRSNLWLLDGERRIAAALRPPADTRPELSLGEPWRSPESRAPAEGQDRFADVPDERLLEAIEERYAGAEEEGARDALVRRIDQALRKEQRSLERKLEKLGRELEAARDAAQLDRAGELLKSVLSRVKRGDTEAVARDFESGEEVRIPLDPTLSPAENLERLFKRYRKALRGLTKAGAQEDRVRGALEELRALREEHAALGEDQAALEAFAERPPLARLLSKYAAPVARAPRREPERRLAGQRVPGRLLPRRYPTAGGLEIWVGRSDAGNDFLSTRLARGKDLFFHLDGAPGSHVILRTEGRSDPPSEAILDACELAVHFSKFRNATRADIHVVPIQNVKKPRGAKPGLVMVHGGKTVHLRRTPQRLARILDSRLEE